MRPFVQAAWVLTQRVSKKPECLCCDNLLPGNPPSSAGPREIPVLRSASAAPPPALNYKMPVLSGHPRGDVQDEYYRREVMTRTVITRSTEALSLQRMEAIEREKQRLEDEAREARRREEERREADLLADIQRQAEERERLRRAQEREEKERIERIRREQQRVEMERMDMYELERAAANRKLQRQADLEKERQREELDKKANEIAEMERRANERREMERLEEERSLAELKEKERRNQEIRDRERKEAEERAAARQREERRSRDKLDMIVRERSAKERFEQEKRRLLAEKEALSNKYHFLTSSETLQKLAKPLYISRETLSNPEFTTKIERQMIERLDRNVWIDDVRNPSQQTVSCSLNSTNEENVRDRMYNPNDLSRNGSSRTSRYRAKMEKARREFIAGGPETTDSDSVSDRFRRSQEDMALRLRRDYRGPLLQKFHDSEFKAKTDADGFPYPRVEPSPYAQEFERLLEETERRYTAYRMRMSQPNLYSRSRCWSTNYLETDVDTGKPELAYVTREVEETNLDDVHRRSGSVVDYHRQSRRDRTEDVPDTTHIRSRSADYLMDRRTREESAPPENELQKTVADLSSRASNVGEHGLRFRKSTEKLTVPNWYLENTSARSFTKSTDLSQQAASTANNRTASAASTGIDFPKGMFDRYKDEIEDLRRSRSSLHQLKEQRQVVAL
ncbi:hypothetical protein OESDEN_02670 [Oesophagostomum dentatum]|uniref:Uncharacterized protein n=1 Tax=Oesophagostomum dentatum TaxID=61180 RepID=A0A0B1TJB3_OESDE|nr:hypothetical protein OESDEN_02670 [Oesophagostomum dentatum]